MLNFLFRKKEKHQKIEVFVRHCHLSTISQHKVRFPGFTREAAHENLLQTINLEEANLTFFLDTFHPQQEEHFIKTQRQFPVVECKEGSETGSFLKLLEHVESLDLPSETIVYFLEDDYFHRPGWTDVLREGFSLPQIDYVTLYDHRDKYTSEMYKDLRSKIYATATCHWRTTPSTTNTYAMKSGTLKAHMDTHRQFSMGRKISDDHGKFCRLGELGAVLISSIPGWSTHAEEEFASPCIEWQKMIQFHKVTL